MEFPEIQQQLNQASQNRTRTEQELFKAKEKLRKIRREGENLARFAGMKGSKVTARSRTLTGRAKELESAVADLSAKLEREKEHESAFRKDLLAYTDPTENLPRLVDSYPILLLPLRIETRFKRTEISEFQEKEFEGSRKIQELCEAISRDYPRPTGPGPTNTLEWLNKVLQVPDLFKRVTKGASQKPPTTHVLALSEKYNRSKAQKDLQILNRSVLEEFYPEQTPQNNQLLVRVFPDEIAVDSFEEVLSENEVRNARSYWSSMWRAGDIEEDQRAAWRLLVSNHGSGRAHWIVQNYRVRNEQEKPARRTTREINLIIATDNPPADDEQDLLKTFWEAMWSARDDIGKQAAAREILVGKVGQQRAKLLEQDYRPFNFADTPPAPLGVNDAILEVAFLIFPRPDEVDTKVQAWSKAPKVNVLPERLVLLAFEGTNRNPVVQLIGNPIPSSLAAGPDPSRPEGEQFRIADVEQTVDGKLYKKGDLIVDEELRWMVDFQEAVTKGMGFRVSLTREQASDGFSRLYVLGVRIGADKDGSKTAIESLIDHHHHSRKGFSILSQGTPTNNTEKESSGYTWREDSDRSFDLFFSDKVPDDPSFWTEKKDGRWLTEMLGIRADKIRSVENYYGTDLREARAMNTALWPATLGYFMETMMAPVFSDEVIGETRSFFEHFVIGRGMIPAIRVGKQPYGILPATPFSRLKWPGVRHPATQGIFTGYFGTQFSYLYSLYKVLAQINADRTKLLELVSRVGTRGDKVDAHQILLDVVGLQSSSVEWYSRYAESIDQIYNTLNLKGFGAALATLLLSLGYTNSGMDLLASFGYTGKGDEGTPDILKKFFFSRGDLLKGPLIDDVPLSETSPVRAYAEKEGKKQNYLQWLIDAAQESHDALRKQEGFTDNKPPAALLYLMLHHALDLGYVDASIRLHLSAGLFDGNQAKAARKEPLFIQMQEGAADQESRWKYLYNAAPQITGNASTLVGSYISEALNVRDETAGLAGQIQALELLKEASTARLERVFAEHLDSCSYRLDAWLLGLVHAQLALMRNIQDADKATPPATGLYIGAYGWLEDVQPEQRELAPANIDDDLKQIFEDPEHPLTTDSANGGYIHAPSVNHAVTAAVLRNGFITDATRSNPGTLAVNLSSERVRTALSIIEGMRNGQSLSALLGYRLERGLHDNHGVNQAAELDEFIFDLRKAFPLNANRITTTKEPDLEELDIRTVEARNVIDGLALIEQTRKSGKTTYPFGMPDLPSATPVQESAINQEVLAILDANDAVADLALAESVHQVVQGNYDRAAATLDTYSKGNFPPTPDVIRTPRSGVTLTHRVGLQLESVPITEEFSDKTPRAIAEPAVNKWLSSVLPPMGDVVCSVQFYDDAEGKTRSEWISMQQLGLEPIDLVYMVRMEQEQAMTALDDVIVWYTAMKYAMDLEVKIDAEVRIDIKYLRDGRTSERLSKLPANIDFPDAIKRKIQYDAPEQLLVFTGMMSEQERNTLLALSNKDDYLNAVKSLFDRSQPPENGKLTLFELAPMLNSLRALLEQSRPLKPTDVKPTGEAKKAGDASLYLNPKKITLVRGSLKDLKDKLGVFLDGIPASLDAGDEAVIIPQIDTWINDAVSILKELSLFGLPQTGFGHLLEWRRQQFSALRQKVRDLVKRWEDQLSEFSKLIDTYNRLPATATDEERFSLLQRAERLLSTTSTIPLPGTPDKYRDDLVGENAVAFQDELDKIESILWLGTLSETYSAIESEMANIPAFDIIGMDIKKEKKLLLIFARDLKAGAENLLKDLGQRLARIAAILPDNDDDIDSRAHITQLLEAGKKILGDNFRFIPEFVLSDEQAAEWKNAFDDKDKILQYQRNNLHEEFPVDGWLYGLARVREKMHHIENVAILADTLNGKDLKWEPIQFPYHENDCWLGLEYPTTNYAGIAAVKVDEDKLLYTAHYAVPFDKAKAQCGLLLDEWTEVIPTEDETTGLTFHYDRPNCEPPQTLLLVTPSEFKGSWQWQDLVDTLHDTLDLAKKRAIEPGHIDTTAYARFLPALVSAVVVHPVTSALNLALNNEIQMALAHEQ